jgi:hypothetical protein
MAARPAPAVELNHMLAALETGPENPKLLHLADQSRALHAEFGGRAFRAADHPTGSLKRVQNQSAFGRCPRASG